MWNAVCEEFEMIFKALADSLFYMVLGLLFASVWAQPDIVWPLFPLIMAFSVMFVVDVKHFVLPDVITIPFILLGLWMAPKFLGIGQWDSIYGALAGAGLFGLLSFVFYAVRKKHGLGIGDIKLLALIGAWGGVAVLLPTLLFASVFALLFLPVRRVLKGIDISSPLPFGPFLIVGGWVSLLFGNEFWHFLLKINGKI